MASPATVEKAGSVSPPPAAQESDAMAAALALTDLFAAPSSSTPTRACEATHLPGASSGWPFVDGKGCFAKGRDGKDVPFLERLFLLLSFPRLAVPGHPGSCLGDAIRWKTREAINDLGLPSGTAAFEIVDVGLLEAAVYPQYASGSFNKTAAKWGLFSPRPEGASKRLSRDCIVMPRPGPSAPAALRPLPGYTLIDDVTRHIEAHIRPAAGVPRPAKAGPVAATPDAAAATASADNAAALVSMPSTQRAPCAKRGPSAGAAMGTCGAGGAGGAAALEPSVLTQIVAAVNSHPDVPSISEDQLRAIIALSANAARSEAAHASGCDRGRDLGQCNPHQTPWPTPSSSSPPVATIPQTLPTTPAKPAGLAGNAPVVTTWSIGSSVSSVSSVDTPKVHVLQCASNHVNPAAPCKPAAAALAASGAKRPHPNPNPSGAKRLHGGAQWGELHVALWDKVRRRRISSKAYKGDLHAYLQAHPHLEVYNRQDAEQGGHRLLAGQKVRTEVCVADGLPKVVLWHTREARKLTPAESPAPSGLCAFLRAHPEVEVFNGQVFNGQLTAGSTPAGFSLPGSSPEAGVFGRQQLSCQHQSPSTPIRPLAADSCAPPQAPPQPTKGGCEGSAFALAPMSWGLLPPPHLQLVGAEP